MLQPFAKLIGTRLISVTPDRIEAELPVTPELCNINGGLHGGAIMGFADNLGGTAAVANITADQITTTIESKTNFFAPILLGDIARGETTPLHRGRTTMVWQTRITRGDGKLAALVTQTQMVLPRKREHAQGGNADHKT